ncbi:hypothetical protein EV284_6477 [Streptomyces sp. BK022]|uniref:hypothetical protein n=1 Tax=Streptomyces sp. BK022 TaxID=2512123 RepID=UPI0010EB513F|nr:hypothetical protein [Streptomyces sp. BK022]RZU28311.1 hypothetical protein EV284_6477 [Streptomyces sp. BK022]
MSTAIAPQQESLFAWLTDEPVPSVPQVKAEPLQKTAPPPAKPPTETKRPARKKKKDDLSHVWVVAAEVEVEPKIAKMADSKGSFKTPEGMRVDALDVYCRECRRPYDEVRGEDCAAKIDNRHLIGGDQSVRAKRKPAPAPPKNARIIPGGRINRRGVDAYMSGVSRPPR